MSVGRYRGPGHAGIRLMLRRLLLLLLQLLQLGGCPDIARAPFSSFLRVAR